MLERLTEDPMTLNFGVVAMSFTEKEELVMSEDVNVADIRIKPSGQPYVSHPTYTKWLNRAFGRGRWHMRPLAKPAKAGNSVVVPYSLMVRGVPVATAYGEQEYFDSNREQTYGDALEATVASALRRCCKRLGIGLEMWDRQYLNRFIDKYAICVNAPNWKGEMKKQWRLRADDPFPGESGVARQSDRGTPEAQRQQTRRRPQATAEHSAATHPKATEPVTNDQVIRLWTIARRAGRNDDEVKIFLKRHYNLESSKAIQRKDYENITKALEHPGPLLPVLDINAEREPGEDDR